MASHPTAYLYPLYSLPGSALDTTVYGTPTRCATSSPSTPTMSDPAAAAAAAATATAEGHPDDSQSPQAFLEKFGVTLNRIEIVTVWLLFLYSIGWLVMSLLPIFGVDISLHDSNAALGTMAGTLGASAIALWVVFVPVTPDTKSEVLARGVHYDTSLVEDVIFMQKRVHSVSRLLHTFTPVVAGVVVVIVITNVASKALADSEHNSQEVATFQVNRVTANVLLAFLALMSVEPVVSVLAREGLSLLLPPKLASRVVSTDGEAAEGDSGPHSQERSPLKPRDGDVAAAAAAPAPGSWSKFRLANAAVTLLIASLAITLFTLLAFQITGVISISNDPGWTGGLASLLVACVLVWVAAVVVKAANRDFPTWSQEADTKSHRHVNFSVPEVGEAATAWTLQLTFATALMGATFWTHGAQPEVIASPADAKTVSALMLGTAPLGLALIHGLLGVVMAIIGIMFRMDLTKATPGQTVAYLGADSGPVHERVLLRMSAAFIFVVTTLCGVYGVLDLLGLITIATQVPEYMGVLAGFWAAAAIAIGVGFSANTPTLDTTSVHTNYARATAIRTMTMLGIVIAVATATLTNASMPTDADVLVPDKQWCTVFAHLTLLYGALTGMSPLFRMAVPAA